MNLLLDTHVLIWYLEGNQELSINCRTAIEDSTNTNFVSIASFWEISIKLSIGNKLELSVPFDRLSQLTWQNNISVLPIHISHTSVVTGNG